MLPIIHIEECQSEDRNGNYKNSYFHRDETIQISSTAMTVRSLIIFRDKKIFFIISSILFETRQHFNL